MGFIQVTNLCKEYKVRKKETGAMAKVKSLFVPQYEVKEAVRDISFAIDRGETVGYIGMNGAGKSTTIKMMTGILTPTSGSVVVDGLVPYEARVENARRMGVVFGQRSRLNWDLPIGESFELYRRIYDIDKKAYQRNVSQFVDALEMGEFLNRPVRQLSLGERMRANLALAFLHDPAVVYLDEPTIGLDVVVKNKVRKFIKEMNAEKRVTIMLTTHDMYDIENICSRLIFIHKGQILYDGTLMQFKDTFGAGYVMELECDARLDLRKFAVDRVTRENNKYVIHANRNRVNPEEILRCFVSEKIPIQKLEIREASVESAIVDFFSKERNS